MHANPFVLVHHPLLPFQSDDQMQVVYPFRPRYRFMLWSSMQSRSWMTQLETVEMHNLRWLFSIEVLNPVVNVRYLVQNSISCSKFYTVWSKDDTVSQILQLVVLNCVATRDHLQCKIFQESSYYRGHSVFGGTCSGLS